MKANCKICKHPQRDEILSVYFATDSLRKTAQMYDVNYKTLHTHIQRCLADIGFIKRDADFFTTLWNEASKLTAELNRRYNAPRLDKRIPRPQPMVTKKIAYTWSRRAWKRGKQTENH